MQEVARFDRGPNEEVRVSLTDRQGQTFLELRVHPDPPDAPETFRLPATLLGELDRALQAAREALRLREAAPQPSPGTPERPGTGSASPSSHVPRAGMPIVGRWGMQSGRTDVRVPLECFVEYSVRGRGAGAEKPPRRRGRTIDISRHGLGLLLPERVSIFNVLQIDLHLPQGVLSLLGEVVWAQLSKSADPTGEGCRHGLRFTEMGPEERRHLDRLLEDLGG